jgi:uncharacterized protein with PQ loop repeat
MHNILNYETGTHTNQVHMPIIIANDIGLCNHCIYYIVILKHIHNNVCSEMSHYHSQLPISHLSISFFDNKGLLIVIRVFLSRGVR